MPYIRTPSPGRARITRTPIDRSDYPGDRPDVVGGSQDLPAAELFNIVLNTPTPTGISVTFNTGDVPTDDQIVYNTTSKANATGTPEEIAAQYSSSNERSGTLTLEHTVIISGLANNTTRYFRIIVRNAQGLATISTEYSFTTASPALPAPVISNVVVDQITSTSARITGNVNQSATVTVKHGLVSGSLINSVNAGTVAANGQFQVTLSGLQSNTTHYFLVEAAGTDAIGVTTESSFNTLAAATGGLTQMTLIGVNPNTLVLGDYVETDGSITKPIREMPDSISVNLRFTRSAASDVTTGNPTACWFFKKDGEPDADWDISVGGWRAHISDDNAPEGEKGRIARLEEGTEKAFIGSIVELEHGVKYNNKIIVRDGSESVTVTFDATTWADDRIIDIADLPASTVFVDFVNGNDTTGNGSEANPYKTINKVQGLSNSGVKVTIKSGIYPSVIGSTGATIRTLPITLVGETPCVTERDSTTWEISLIDTPHVVVSGQLFSAPTGSPANDPYKVYDDANLVSGGGLAGAGSGIAKWEATTVVGTFNGITYNVWKWANISSSLVPNIGALIYSNERFGQFNRMHVVDQTTTYTNPAYQLPLHNLSPGDFAEVIATSPTLFPHAARIFDDPANPGRKAIYMLWIRPENPNDFWWEASAFTRWGFILRAEDCRISQIHIRSVSIGCEFGNSSINSSNVVDGVIDRCAFDVYQFATRASGGGTVANRGRNGSFSERTTIRRNLFLDSKLRSDTLEPTNDLIPWVSPKEWYLRDKTRFDYLPYPGPNSPFTGYARFNRPASQSESTAFGINGGTRQVLFEENHLVGMFNGFTMTGDPVTHHYKDVGLAIRNRFDRVVDDCAEPEKRVTNFLFVHNRMYNTMNPISVAPLQWGPVYFVRNLSWETGVHGMGQFKDPDYEAVAHTFSLDSNMKNRVDGGAANNFLKGQNINTTFNGYMYIVHNTHWTTRGNKPGVYGEQTPTVGPNDSGANDPSGLPKYPIRYVRNNVFRVTGYATRWTANHGLYVDEDYNIYVSESTDYGARINSGGNTTYPQFNGNSTLATGAGSPEDYRNFLAARPNRPTYFKVGQHTNLLDSGVTVPFAGTDAAALLDSMFVDPINGDMRPKAGANSLIGSGIKVCNISDRPGVDFVGTAPSIGYIEP